MLQRGLLLVLLAVIAFPAGTWLALGFGRQEADRATDAIRTESAAREGRWATSMVQRYRRVHGRDPESVAALNAAVPEAEIQARDPWGGEWAVSRPSGAPTDVWLCSRGPGGTSPCPRASVALPPAPLAARAIPWIVLGVMLSAPAAALAAVVVAARRRRWQLSSTPWALRAAVVVGIVAAVGILNGLGMAVGETAILAKIAADVRALNEAIEAYRAATGTAPSALTDLTTRVGAGDRTAGPFIVSLPSEPTHRGWRYRYRHAADGSFVLTAEGPPPSRGR
jgi:type II secretory pathway pseudopilin PulG